MNSRKRCAAEPVLPEHNPKHPRLTTSEQSSGASNSVEGGLFDRWTSLGKQLVELVADTATSLVPVTLSVWQPTDPGLSDDAMSSSSPTSSSPISTPRQTPTPLSNGDIAVIHDSSTPKQSIPIKMHSPITSSFLEHFKDERVLDGLAFSTPKPQPHQPSNSPSHGTSLTYPSPGRTLDKDVVPSLTGLRLQSTSDSRQSSQTSNSSSSLIASTLGTDITLQSKSGAPKRHPLRRNPKDREHIYAKVHKAQVLRDKTQLREEMTRELYDLKRKTGFTSGFKDFKGLLDFQRQLQNLDLEHAPPRLIPFSPLRPQTPKPTTSSDDLFLQRALENAKATLNSPKPAKPFLPSLEHLQISRRLKDEAIDKLRQGPPLPSSLPPEDEQYVTKILQKRGVVSKFAKEQVSDSDLSRLRPGQWLNDEIINFYGAMILARSEGSKENQNKSKKKPLNVHYFSSFFWSKLTRDGYERGRLGKWTKKIDIFSTDVILIPVNHGNAHWTAASINFRQKRFESYDSMNIAKGVVFKALRSYVNDEHMNKKKKPFNFDGWVDYAPPPPETPQQENGFDCGVFTCQFMAALSIGEPFNFTQKDMPYLRRRMLWEIGNAKLRDGP